MSANQKLQRIFDELAAGLELQGANSFRANSHRRVARQIRDMSEDVRELVDRDPATAEKRLRALPDIGEGAARRILEFLETGAIAQHTEMLEKVPRGLFDILKIPGLGPKTVKSMWQELGITGLADLESSLDSPELSEMPRMGKKTIDNIRQAIEFANKSVGRIPIGKARPIAERLVEQIAEVPGVSQACYAGSLRRGRETIGDLDFLVVCEDSVATGERFVGLEGVTQVLAQGESKCSVRYESENVAIQADLRIVPRGVWGAALMYFTGSKEHNVRLRQIAIRQKKHLNEFGLFSGTEERPQDRDEVPLAAATEESIYTELGLPFVPPELREDRGELEGVPEDLIEEGDIVAELHSHTTESDGKLELDELIAEALRRGLRILAVTDHSQSSVLANGLEPDRLRSHIERVRAANQRFADIEVLAGTEVDILPDGSLDYDDELLAELDLVVASPHASLNQDPATATRRLLQAIENPHVDILGHPTGRQIGKRRGLEPDMHALVEAAARTRTALEVNANPRRLDLRDTHVRLALDAGCLIAVDTDAHSSWHFDYRVYGLLTARRAGLPRERCINTWDITRLREWLTR